MHRKQTPARQTGPDGRNCPVTATADPISDETPVEARGSVRAGYGNRTRLSSLGSSRSTDELIPRRGRQSSRRAHYAGWRCAGVLFRSSSSPPRRSSRCSSTASSRSASRRRSTTPSSAGERPGGAVADAAEARRRRGLDRRAARASRWSSTSGRRWCEPCKDEAPALERAQRAARRRGRDGARRHRRRLDARTRRRSSRSSSCAFPSLRDVDGELGEDYGRTGVPGDVRDRPRGPGRRDQPRPGRRRVLRRDARRRCCG